MTLVIAPESTGRYSPIEVSADIHQDNLQRNKHLLEVFIRQQAPDLGMDPASLQLRVVEAKGTMECLPSKKIVFIGEDLVRNYGREELIENAFVDQCPDEPDRLRAFLSQLSPRQFEYAKKHFSERISDIELRAAITHELGHIALQHGAPKNGSQEDFYRMELDADVAACRTNVLRQGVIRGFKRAIIQEVFENGQEAYHKVKDAAVPYLYFTHPSHDLRLKQALLSIPLE